MANIENLIPFNERTESEKRRIALMGGKASGQARREKATLKKTLEMLLDEKNKDTGKTYREMATLGLIKGATEGKAENYKVIAQLIGELTDTEFATTPSVKIEVVDHSNLEKQMYENKDL